MANSVDPDQMLHSAASDVGLHCLQRPVCPNTEGYYGSDNHNMFNLQPLVGLTQDNL